VRLFLGSIGLFVLASLACGLSRSLEMLIFFQLIFTFLLLKNQKLRLITKLALNPF